MRRNFCALTLLTAGLLASSPASAAFINASATVASAPLADGVTFDYHITLVNASASTDTVGTFWFAWTPGQDYMSASPSTEVSPSGWKAKVTHGGATDGYAIQWTAASAASYIAPGGSLIFEFLSTVTPTELAGNSPFFPNTPEETSVLYNAAPFSADSETIVASASAVPEPSALVLSLIGGVTAIAGRRLAGRGRARA